MRQRGQVTVELLLIISVLLVILLVSINIFGTQTGVANSKQNLLELRQNQEKIVELIYQAANAPTGTTIVAFIPISQVDQNFFVRGKNLYGSGAEYDLISSLPTGMIDSNSFSSGEFIRVAHRVDGLTIGPAIIPIAVGGGADTLPIDGGDGDAADGG
jgi:amino acid permease